MSAHQRGKTFVEFPALEDESGDMSDEQLFALSARRILEQIASEDHALFLRALALANGNNIHFILNFASASRPAPTANDPAPEYSMGALNATAFAPCLICTL